jgi:XTP/dITP diphosphohydrolase
MLKIIMRSTNWIVCATNNHHKVEEFQELFKAHKEKGPIEVVPADKVVRNVHNLGDVEVFNTYLENALAKARVLQRACHYPVLADDSGLEVEALLGAPGVHSARYAIDHPSVPQTENVKKLLKEMMGKASRKALFRSVVVFMMDGICLQAEGVLEGEILLQPDGVLGFGYDSVFKPLGSKVSLAQMSLVEKCALSHRKIAIDQLMQQVKELGLVLAKP